MAIEKLKISPLFTYSLFISLMGIVAGLVAQFVLPPEVPLFYGLPQTENQLVSPIWVVLPSSIALIVTILNYLLTVNMHDSYLKKVMATASIFCSLLALITTLKIIFLVGSI